MFQFSDRNVGGSHKHLTVSVLVLFEVSVWSPELVTKS